jgi:probable addiction module antidote protein
MPAYLFGVNMFEEAASPSISPQSSRDEVADNINRAFEAADIAEICRAIGVIARLYNRSDLAQQSGLERANLYRAFSGGSRHPNFKTVLGVLDAMGFQLHVTARRDPRARPARLKPVQDPPSPLDGNATCHRRGIR